MKNLKYILEAHLLKGVPDLLVLVLREGVEVFPEGGVEEGGVLGDDGDVGPQLVEAQGPDVLPVYQNLALGLRETE